MRVLFDECVSRRFAREFPEHDIRTTRQMGWLSVKNGMLLALAAKDFDVFVTIDNNIAYQQNLNTLPLPVIVLRVKHSRLANLKALAPAPRKALEKVPSEPVTLIGPL